ncbi:hypothetical protein ANANG_G00147710 [Anguilla anguilla]|uniref:USP domain-containing protein n=1 Tax=Anguilla anguilla TaxID=7936 RepID=A0A9D3MC18_ANGAN|nr:hypothetical protein ANANG_G00147710 [Anguilla anguilla]
MGDFRTDAVGASSVDASSIAEARDAQTGADTESYRAAHTHQRLPQAPDSCETNPDIYYRGLRNLGATCYLNTVLQMLYMTRSFREAVEREECEDGLVLQLKKIFAGLKTAESSTMGFAQTLGIRNVFEQQDAAEYFQRILNRISPHLSQMFQGRLRNSTVCVRGQHEPSVDLSPFIVLPLSLQLSHESLQQHSLVDSLDAFFTSSVLDGDNQMYCDICEEKTDTETRCEMEQYPQVLTLHLKRFEFDYNWMCYVKNSRSVEIPLTLELEKHTYDLYAIADHQGTYKGGHYVAHIRSYETQSWYCFDDAWVGKHERQPSSREVMRSENAYLLMYMKRDIPNYQPGPSPASPETPAETETVAAPDRLADPEMPEMPVVWKQERKESTHYPVREGEALLDSMMAPAQGR